MVWALGDSETLSQFLCCCVRQFAQALEVSRPSLAVVEFGRERYFCSLTSWQLFLVRSHHLLILGEACAEWVNTDIHR